MGDLDHDRAEDTIAGMPAKPRQKAKRSSPRGPKSKVLETIKDELGDVLKEVYRDLKKTLPAQKERLLDRARLSFGKARDILWGKTLAILGPPAAGKTTLFHVLKQPEVSGQQLQSYRKTEVDGIKAFRCKWKLNIGGEEQIEFHFKVKKTSDVGGESYVRENHWGKVITEAEILVYVFDIQTFLQDSDGSYKARIKEDFDWLLVHSQKPKVNFTVMLVANKVDLCCERETFATFEKSQKPSLEEFVSKLRSNWKAGLHASIKGITFLSLTDDILRHLTFDNLILGFIGEDLRSLYLKAQSKNAV